MSQQFAADLPPDHADIPGWWKGAVMRARPNRAFQFARRARGLTQAQVADATAELVERATGRRCGIDADYISKVERGEINWPGKAYRTAFQLLLGAASDAELGLYCPRSSDGTPIVAPSIVGGEPIWAEDGMLDRDLIRRLRRSARRPPVLPYRAADRL